MYKAMADGSLTIMPQDQVQDTVKTSTYAGLISVQREIELLSIQQALAHKDASWLESLAKLRLAARQWQTALWSLCHTNHCMVPSTSWYSERNWR